MLLTIISILTLYRIILSVLTNVPLLSLTETAAEELRREHIYPAVTVSALCLLNRKRRSTSAFVIDRFMHLNEVGRKSMRF